MARRPAGDGSIFKRADGRWEGRIVVGHKKNGTPIYKSAFGKTQKELLPKFNELKKTYAGIELTEESQMRLSEWLDKWLNEYKRGMIRDSTVDGYEKYIENHIKPYLGDKMLTQLTTADIQRMYNTLKKEGRVHADKQGSRELSNSMVRSIHTLLHGVLDGAVREGLIPRNPTEGTVLPKHIKSGKTVLLESQIERFMKAIEGDVIWHDLFYTEFMTGLRRGEICGLQWSDIDEENGVLYVRRTIKYAKGELVISETKTAQGHRKIIMPESLSEMMKERRKTCFTEWVFPKQYYPAEPINPESAYRRLKTILQAANLPNMRFHDLRHTFATHAAASGIDPKTLAGILGHTKASFTLDTYTHVTTDMQKQAAGIVGNFITDVFGKSLKPWEVQRSETKGE